MKVGDRVALVFTDDEYTRLRPGSLGTLVGIVPDPAFPSEQMLEVDWDDGSNLSMLTVAGDRIEVVEQALFCSGCGIPMSDLSHGWGECS